MRARRQHLEPSPPRGRMEEARGGVLLSFIGPRRRRGSFFFAFGIDRRPRFLFLVRPSSYHCCFV